MCLYFDFKPKKVWFVCLADGYIFRLRVLSVRIQIVIIEECCNRRTSLFYLKIVETVFHLVIS
jgi:hypothetical protein